MARERYDGADIAHLLLRRAERLDWRRLLRRFEPHRRVLLSHLTLFGFIYPSERARIPAWVMAELLDEPGCELSAPPPAERVCYGTLLSWDQYQIDAERGYLDGRLRPYGTLTAEQVAHAPAVLHEENQSALE